MICILHVFDSPHAPRESGYHSSVGGYGVSIWFQVQSSVSFKKKKRKRNIFQELEKNRKHLFGALQITSTHTHALSFSLFFSLVKFTRQEHASYDTHATQFCSWKRLVCRYLLVTTFRYFYTHDLPSTILSCTLYSCLPHSRSPSSFYQIYLPIYFSVVHSFASILTLLWFYAMYMFPGGPVAKESGMLARLKK